MVGGCKNCRPRAPAFTQQHTLWRRRLAQRRSVEGSGDRDESRQSGAAWSEESPTARRSQASCRQRNVNGAAGTRSVGRTVKVFPQGRQIPRRTQISSCRSSWAGRRRRPWPTRWTDSGKVGSSAAGGATGSPRLDVVFGLRQCDKKNHGWREGPPVTVSWQSFDLLVGPSPSRQKISFERKKNTPLWCRRFAPRSEHWPL